ncbi:MAG: hypothetical protein RLZZ276_3519 [Pseudomonadota bacterium]
MTGRLLGLAFGLGLAFAAAVPGPAPVPLANAQQAPAQQAQPQAPQDEPRFAFRRLDVDHAGLQPRVCLQFTRKLRAEGVRYLDYVAIAPQARPGVSVEDDRLCLTGLAYGTDYEIDLRPGLPSADEQRLAASERVGVTLTARPPVVAFTGGGRILVRAASDGLPVTTVNVPEVALRVFRVGERGFAAVRDQFRQNERRSWGYALEQMRNDTGELVWSGTLATANPPNREVVTSFPLGEVIGNRRAGIYWIAAYDAARGGSDDDDNRWSRQLATQWVVSTDIALSVLRAADGLHVIARDFAGAKPMPGLELRLVSRSNEELGRARSDAEGRATFAPGLLRGTGAQAPVSVMAFGPGEDFALIDLDRAAFDLADRGVEGRAPPGPIDVYAWTERGIYRPGETVAFAALLRDAGGDAVPGLQAQVVLRRPNGSEARRFALAADATGALSQAIALTATSARGMWSAEVLVDPSAPPIGRARFEVQDFVPQKLKVELAPGATAYAPGEQASIAVASRFLYGAPAADLATEAEVTLEFDPLPHPQLRGFFFGHDRERAEFPQVEMAAPRTDAQGRATVTGTLPDPGALTRPLRAVARVAVLEPGGRATSESTSFALKGAPVQLGLRPLFAPARNWWDGSERPTTPWDSTARFELVAIDAEGRRIAVPVVEWRLVREESLWNWVRSGNGGWSFEEVVRERVVASGRGRVDADRFAEIAADVAWGRYRMQVRVPGVERAQAAVSFQAGWGGGDLDRTPDKLEVVADRQLYRAGETARLRIDAAHAGEATILVATDRVHSMRNVSVPAGGTSVEIPVDAAWGPGAYALVSMVRPLEAPGAGRAPLRAIGVAWLGVDTGARRLAVEIGAPARARPRGPVEVSLRVPGAGADARVTLAAVDEGILQLTRHASPDPHAHVFAKRRLGAELRDDYGRVIDGRAGSRGAIRQGGDAGFGRGLEVVPLTIVSLFHGPIALDAEGRARVTLDIPDFAGELRLMAVAWDGTRLGAGEARMTVRDAIVADATFPRFLAPGDEGRVALWLHNVEGEAGTWRASWSVEGGARVAGEAARSVALARDGRELLSWPLVAGEPGLSTFRLTMSGPGGASFAREWRMETRPAQARTTEARIERIAPGAALAVAPRQVAGAVPGSVQATVEVASWRGFDVPALLRALDRYPFGCLEQTTSRAFPLLVLNDAAALIGRGEERGIERRVQDAIWRVLDLQRPDGGFGLWGPGDDPAQGWLQVYAADFLLSAKKRGMTVPDEALGRALRWMRGTASRLDGGDEARAYALYVLAREGRADLGTMRYVHDARARAYENPLVLAQLGAALQMAGDEARAGGLFQRSLAALDRDMQRTDRRSFDGYGSPLRDLAGTISAAAASGRVDMLDQLFRRFSDAMRLPQLDATTTQEKAWMLLATQAMAERGGRINVDAAGEAVMGRSRASFELQPEQLRRGFRLENRGERDVWATTTVSWVPSSPLPAASRRLTIRRTHWTLSGERADLSKLRQNDRVVVWIEVGGLTEADRQANADIAITDLLPAGLEIEAPLRRVDDEGATQFRFLGTLSRFAVVEARDDRFVAAARGGELTEPALRIGYVARAITPGRYILPAAQVEDMYRPELFARTAAGRVDIAP